MTTTASQVLELLAATGLGGAVGLERELSGQPAGFRTHVLVALGAALFSTAGTDLAGTDPTRVAAQVVTGIGFLGAGAILREGGGVKGLTTAASLFVTAAAGVACGLHRPLLGAVSVALSLLTLVGLKRLEQEYFPRRRGHPVVLEISDTADVQQVVAAAVGVLGSPAEVRKVERAAGDRTAVTLTSPLGHGHGMLDLATRLRALEGVVGVELGS